MGDTEARLQRLEDLESIRRLLVDYAKHLDAADYGAYASLFKEDGELTAPIGSARGRAAIRALLEERLAEQPEAPRPTALHLVANPDIELDGDRATSRVLWAYVTQDENSRPFILQLGHYDDVLVRTDAGWRFQRRQITRDLGVSPIE